MPWANFPGSGGLSGRQHKSQGRGRGSDAPIDKVERLLAEGGVLWLRDRRNIRAVDVALLPVDQAFLEGVRVVLRCNVDLRRCESPAE